MIPQAQSPFARLRRSDRSDRRHWPACPSKDNGFASFCAGDQLRESRFSLSDIDLDHIATLAKNDQLVHPIGPSGRQCIYLRPNSLSMSASLSST